MENGLAVAFQFPQSLPLNFLPLRRILYEKESNRPLGRSRHCSFNDW
jgi:hypothetical protein